MSDTLLEIRNIAKSFPGVRALDDVSFHLSRGEVLTLAGENGAGKSTLLAILGGSLAPDQGTVTVDGVRGGGGAPPPAGGAGGGRGGPPPGRGPPRARAGARDRGRAARDRR
ncbi:ATP-binding cassette domain-containing protein, partial [Arthrobacter sp. SRS-W-1-2016]|uniref:ATP-binding cassette domain-containing protein n=1 Tax=Arthrobacter sp. SRS-W-1-2016 TaxID=1930254 RepID=UPI0011162FF1